MMKLRHRNIVVVYEYLIDEPRNTLFIVMEHLDGGDLSQLIAEYKRQNAHPDREEGLPEKIILDYLLQLAQVHNLLIL